MLETIICYKTKIPVVYNAGTQWERTCDHFLLWCAPHLNIKEAQKLCDELNVSRPKTYRQCPITWDNIDYLYTSQQEPMCD